MTEMLDRATRRPRVRARARGWLRPAWPIVLVVLLLGAAACANTTEASGERASSDPSPTTDEPVQANDVEALDAAPGTAEPSPTARATSTPGPAATTEPATASAPTATPTAAPSPAPEPTEAPTTALDTAGAEVLCTAPAPSELGALEDDDIVEASGITRAASHDGWWVHNDDGRAELFAIGPAGEDLATILIEDEEIWDVEDMTSWERNGQRELLVADIGDNRLRREGEHPLLVVAEPDLTADSAPARVVTMRYPDGPHNAEVILADGATGEIVIVTKEEDPDRNIQPELLDARIYAGILSADSETLDLVFAGSIDISALYDQSPSTRDHPFSLAGRGGVFTGGEASADGSVIALRTYGAVWVWDRPEGVALAEALTASDPCEAAGPFELQGEGLAFAADGSWVTVSEGVGTPLWGTG